jgi:hypothetical protein
MKSIYGKYFRIGVIFWSVCFIVLFFSYLLILAPKEKLRMMTDKELEDTKSLVQSAIEAADEKNKTKLISLLTDSGSKLKEFVIDEENADSLPLDIGRISGDVKLDGFSSNYSSGSVQTTRTDNFKHITPRQISVNFNSSFNKFAVFLNNLERRRPVIFVDTFSITRSAESDSSPEVDMKLAVLVSKNS